MWIEVVILIILVIIDLILLFGLLRDMHKLREEGRRLQASKEYWELWMKLSNQYGEGAESEREENTPVS